ncbi:hypothetical protein ACJA23_01360 [Mycoplasma corogypsi]|uniref:hypothetical protein n=1 Tax=Mycoplasma corogypsi TaxID=2106 RepID=UPI003872DF10
MKEVTKYLNKLLNKEKFRWKLYKILDIIFSTLILLMNLTTISLAIYTLVILVDKQQHSGKSFDFSIYILVTLVVLILLSFILTITLAIYKQNTRQNEYNKIYNTLKHLEIKYYANKFDRETFEKYLNMLWENSKHKRKLVITKIIASELKKGGK